MMLQDAVRRENFVQAGHLKQSLQRVTSTNTVNTIRTELEAALAEERYSDAASLRDAGMAWLSGWWAGRAGQADHVGHLLHIQPEFGRQGNTGGLYICSCCVCARLEWVLARGSWSCGLVLAHHRGVCQGSLHGSQHHLGSVRGHCMGAGTTMGSVWVFCMGASTIWGLSGFSAWEPAPSGVCQGSLHGSQHHLGSVRVLCMGASTT